MNTPVGLWGNRVNEYSCGGIGLVNTHVGLWGDKVSEYTCSH